MLPYEDRETEEVNQPSSPQGQGEGSGSPRADQGGFHPGPATPSLETVSFAGFYGREGTSQLELGSKLPLPAGGGGSQVGVGCLPAQML